MLGEARGRSEIAGTPPPPAQTFGTGSEGESHPAVTTPGEGSCPHRALAWPGELTASLCQPPQRSVCPALYGSANRRQPAAQGPQCPPAWHRVCQQGPSLLRAGEGPGPQGAWGPALTRGTRPGTSTPGPAAPGNVSHLSAGETGHWAAPLSQEPGPAPSLPARACETEEMNTQLEAKGQG